MKAILLGAALAALSVGAADASTHHHARVHPGHHKASWHRAAPVARLASIPIPRPRPAGALARAAYASVEDGAIGAGLALAELPAGILADVAAKAELAEDRLYLILTSCPGATMHRQGVSTSIARLNPTFARRLAAAIRDARAHGLRPCIFSAYRPPGYGVGGWRDKYQSAHAYGLAVDMGGIGRAGSKVTMLWRAIAAAHGVFGPYSPRSRAEWNHFEPCLIRAVARAVPRLRRTIAALAPISLDLMWELGDRVIAMRGELVAEVRHAHHAHARRRPVRIAIRKKHVAQLAEPYRIVRDDW